MPTLKEAVRDPLDATGGGTPEQRIDAVYTNYQSLPRKHAKRPWSGSRPEPLQQDAIDFLDLFGGLAAAEAKRAAQLQVSRGVALDRIRGFVNRTYGTGCRAFPHINPYRFAIELALRARRPSVVNQQETVLCGAAGIVSAHFKTDPVQAVNFAIDLVETGSGTLRQYLISPNGHVREEPPPERFKMAQVDWVLLASLRYHFEPLAALIGIFSAEAADPLRQLTKPGLLFSTLTRMGYSTIEDRTFGLDGFSTSTKIASAITREGMHGQSESSRGEANLQKAAADVALGKLVFLWSYGQLTEKTPLRVKNAAFPAATNAHQLQPVVDSIGFPALHWTLVRKLDVLPSNVRIRHYSWGNAREASFPKADFLRVYQGHVMADPA